MSLKPKQSQQNNSTPCLTQQPNISNNHSETAHLSESVGLYIHVPFCQSICPYCAFLKTYWSDTEESQYITALVQEIKQYKHQWGPLSVASIFFGGGTPSCLSPTALTRIIETLHHNFTIPKTTEITMEINPETVTPILTKTIRKLGINRVSLGVQSFKEQDQRFLGRQHSNSKVADAVHQLQDAGLSNLNLDLIFALPNSSSTDIQFSLNEALKLNPTHLSTYALSIEKGTPFAKENVKKCNEDTELAQYHLIRKHLKKLGWHHYEVSNFAKPQHECQHNLIYWNLQPFIGLGPSASSFFQNTHYKQTMSLHSYYQDPTPPLFRTPPPPFSSPESILHDYILANLRRLEGIHIATANHRFTIDFLKKFHTPITQLIENKLLKKTKTHIKVTETGLDLLDSVVEAFL